MERDEKMGFDMRMFIYLIMIIFMSSLITIGVIILIDSSPLPSFALWFFGTFIGFFCGVLGLLNVIYRVQHAKQARTISNI